MKITLAFLGGVITSLCMVGAIIAWPETSTDIVTLRTNALAIQAFRDLGCDPYFNNTGALVTGCKTVKRVEISQ